MFWVNRRGSAAPVARRARGRTAIFASCRGQQTRCGRRIKGALALLALSIAPYSHAQTVDPRTVPSGTPVGRDATTDDTGANADTGNRASASNTTTATQSATTTVQPSFQPAEIGGTTENDASNRRRTAEELLTPKSPTLKPPASPGEFEQYLAKLTGRSIRRFGADLLLPSYRDFAVPATATIPPDYAVNVGDTIAINLIGSVEGSAEFVVDTNGKIFLPKVGDVSVIGVRNRDLRGRIAQAIGKQYRGYDVSVSIVKLRGVRVYVTGFANNPGAYTTNSLSTLVNAVLAAGGPNSGGSFRVVQMYRNGHLFTEFDLYEMLRKGDRSHDPLLQNEDVLFIPPVGEQVAVLGSVNEEAIYEAKRGESIDQLLQYAGGLNALADPSRVVLYRLGEKETFGSREITRDAARFESVAGGDIVQVLSKGSLVQPLERQAVTVRLEGEVARPGNYFVPPNTPLSTVLTMAGGLSPRAYVYGTQMMRDSVRVQQRAGFHDAVEQLATELAAAPLTTSGLTDPTQRAAQYSAANAVLERLRRAEPDGRVVLSIPYGATQLPEDIVLENNDRIVIPPMLKTVGVFGSVYRPASFLMSDSTTLRVREYVEKAGGATRAADKGNIFVVRANGEVMTRKRGAMNARVQPGDVVFVPVKSRSTSLLEKIRDVSTILFQFGLAAAAVVAIQK